jgi:hypothetical protein
MSDLATLSGQVQFQGDWGGIVVPNDRRMVRFVNVPTQNTVRSEAEGRPIFENKIVVFVRHPGERDETAVVMKEGHKYEFPRAWAAFEAGQQPEAEGTPLAILFPADPAIVQHMRACHVFTVEQLAGLTAEAKRRVGMGVEGYVAQAQKFLDAAERAAPMHQVEAMMRQMREENEALRSQILAMAQPTTRGRKRRDDTESEGDE